MFEKDAFKRVLLHDFKRESSVSVLSEIREELEDHLQTINENTAEIEANHERLRFVEQRIDAIVKKVDLILNILQPQEPEPEFDLQPLTQKEKDIFLSLYILSETSSCTYSQVASDLRISEQLVANYITNLIEKGIPVIKTYANKVVYMALEAKFRQLQAKSNIVHLDSKLTAWLR